jgi:hypothetical protein
MLPDPRPYFAELTDPRRETKNKLHKLSDIVMIVAMTTARACSSAIWEHSAIALPSYAAKCEERQPSRSSGRLPTLETPAQRQP